MVGLFRGRALQVAYPHFEQYLPLLGLVFLGIAIIAVTTHWRWLVSRALHEGYIVRAVGTLVIVSALFLYLGTYSVVTAIERIHLFKFGLLGFSLFHAISPQRSVLYRFFAASIIGALIGCIDESVQYFIPQRVFDLKDMRLNIISALLGAVLARNTTIETEQTFGP